MLTEGQSSWRCRNSEKLPWPRCYWCSILVHQERDILSEHWCLMWAQVKELTAHLLVIYNLCLISYRQCQAHKAWSVGKCVEHLPGIVLDTVRAGWMKLTRTNYNAFLWVLMQASSLKLQCTLFLLEWWMCTVLRCHTIVHDGKTRAYFGIWNLATSSWMEQPWKFATTG